MNLNKVSYNIIAEEWASSRNRSFVSRLIVEFADLLPSDANVLEVGCGNGFLTRYLSQRGFTVTGIDAAQEMIRLARELKLPRTTLQTMDFFAYTTQEKFDGILAWDCFFHFPRSKQRGIYSRVSEMLKSGGYLLFTHGDGDDEHTDEMMGEDFYYSRLPKDEVMRMLGDAGLEVIYAHTDFVERDADKALVALARKR